MYVCMYVRNIEKCMIIDHGDPVIPLTFFGQHFQSGRVCQWGDHWQVMGPADDSYPAFMGSGGRRLVSVYSGSRV